MGPEYLRYYREIFEQFFPDTRAQWIFLALLGFSELMQSNVPQTKIAQYLERKNPLLSDYGAITQTSQDIRFSAHFAQQTLDDLEQRGTLYIRSTEPLVISNGGRELHGSFGYEIANARGSLMTLETGLLLQAA